MLIGATVIHNTLTLPPELLPYFVALMGTLLTIYVVYMIVTTKK